MVDDVPGWQEQRRLRQNRAHSARMYDYYLGGHTNYPMDRAAADQVIREFPAIGMVARVNRDFMRRVTRLLAGRGVSHFLDIGSGIPTSPNLHEVAQGLLPSARVVYVDNDPIVITYADALLDSTTEGRTDYVEADVNQTAKLLDQPVVKGLLGLGKPVALSLNALLHFIGDPRDPYEVVGELVEALPSGSYLVLSHCTADFAPEAWHAIESIYREGGTFLEVRSLAAVARFFDGLVLEEPGVVVGHRWHPELGEPMKEQPTDADVSLYAGVACKP